MQLGAVDQPRHLPAQRVDLAHELTLRAAANRRIAGQRADRLRVAGDDERLTAHAGRGQRRLDAGVSAADDYHRRVVRLHPLRVRRRRARLLADAKAGEDRVHELLGGVPSGQFPERPHRGHQVPGEQIERRTAAQRLQREA